MESQLFVLIVEDQESDCALVVREIRKHYQRALYERVDTAEGLRAALDARTWDIIISDYAMPRFDGISALKLVRERGLDIPFILASGTVGEEVAVAAVKAGANDYVMKDSLTRIGTVIEREIREVHARRESIKAHLAVREIDERNRAIITTAAEGIITFDRSGTIESFNQSAERIFGYSAEEAVGQ